MASIKAKTSTANLVRSRNDTMGDTTKKKMEETEKMKKVEKNGEEVSVPVNFEELRDDLFREAAKLISEVPDTRIAIFVTPPNSESDDSVHSFAHPSVEGVLQNFAEDSRQAPVREDAEEDDDDDADEEEEEEEKDDPPPKRFWWEDINYDSMNLEELEAVSERILRTRNQIITQLEARDPDFVNYKDLLHDDKDVPKP